MRLLFSMGPDLLVMPQFEEKTTDLVATYKELQAAHHTEVSSKWRGWVADSFANGAAERAVLPRSRIG